MFKPETVAAGDRFREKLHEAIVEAERKGIRFNAAIASPRFLRQACIAEGATFNGLPVRSDVNVSGEDVYVLFEAHGPPPALINEDGLAFLREPMSDAYYVSYR